MGKGMTFGVKDAQLYVDREFMDAPPHQFLRELLKNAIEAEADRVEFTPEWGAVRTDGVYRLKVADNGRGMTLEELDTYMASFGASARGVDIRGNFGIGARMTLLPWNHAGVLVLSWSKEHPDGLGMVMNLGKEGYELQTLEQSIIGHDVVSLKKPRRGEWLYEKWAAMKPGLISNHGTVVVCYGNTGHEDTFFGPAGYTSAKGHGLKYIVKQLNERFFDMPVRVYASCFFFSDRSFWPKKNSEVLTADTEEEEEALRNRIRRSDVKHTDKIRGYQFKQVYGAKYYLYESQSKAEEDKSQTVNGTVTLSDRTEVTWAYKMGNLPDNHAYAPERGYIAALFDGELYEKSYKLSMFRSFGVHLKSVAERTYLILKPPPSAFPGSSRSRLALENEDGYGSESLPWSQWAEEFYNNLPDFLSDQLANQATMEYDENLERWKQKVEEIASEKCRRYVLHLANHGPHSAGGEEHDSKPTERDGVGPTTGLRSNPNRKSVGGDQERTEEVEKGKAARRVMRRGELPDYSWILLEEMADEGSRFPACYLPRSKRHPKGLLVMAKDHPMIVAFQNELLEQARPSAQNEVVAMTRTYFYLKAGYYIAYTYGLAHHPGWSQGRIKQELWTESALLFAFIPDPEADRILKRKLQHKAMKQPAKPDLSVVDPDVSPGTSPFFEDPSPTSSAPNHR